MTKPITPIAWAGKWQELHKQKLTYQFFRFLCCVMVTLFSGIFVCAITPATARAESEPNNSIPQANSIGVGLQNAEKEATIGTATDEDYFAFTAEAGRTYVIETYNIQGTGTEATGVWLYNSSGSVIANDQNGNNGTGDANARMTYKFITGGTYYVLVRRPQFLNWQGTYSLRILPKHDEPGAAWDAANDNEPNGILELANEILVGLNNAQTHQIFDHASFVTNESDYDWYHFTAEAGRTYVIETYNIQGTGTSATGLKLYNSSGSVVANDQNGINGTGDANARIIHKFVNAGTYYIVVGRKQFFTWQGTYSLRVLPKHDEPGAAWDATNDNEPNDVLELANEIQVGLNNAQTHQIFDHASFVTSDSDHDWYHFTAEAGQTFLIETFDVQASQRATGLWLYNNLGSEITSDPSGNATTGAAKITYQFVTSGRYYLLVKRAQFNNWVGAYSLRLCANSCQIIATPTPTPPPGLQLRAIQPAEGVTSQATNVTISGSAFAAGITVSLQRGTQRHQLNAVTVASATQLQATVPANLLAGVYDLVVQNSAGQRAVLANAFSVLSGAPQILEVLPNQGVSDLPNEISIHGFNFAVGAVARVGATLLPTTRINGNQVLAVVPAGLAAGQYDVVVVNPDTQQGVLTKGYAVYDSTSNNDLFGYSFELWSSPGAPKAGETTQIGLFVHRQGGKSVLTNVKVRFLLGNGAGATLGEATLPFLDPANRFEGTPPLDVTFPAAGEIVVTAVIDPDNVIIEDNEANNVITRTLTVAAPGADRTPPVVTDIQINGGAPQTSNTATNVAVSATDPTPNPSGLKSAYLVEYVFNSAVNQWVPIQQSGWLAYDETPDYYGWNLRPIAGMHYLQVRALDQANNISVGAARAQISYAPPSDTLGRGQTRVYRYTVTAGQQLLVRLEPISGDPDLYVWSSNVAQSARVSNNEQGNEHVLVPVDEVVAGTYQIEVYGYTTTEYRLIVEIGTPAVGAASLAPQPQVTTAKTPPTAPVLPVTNTPDDRQGAPPSPPTSQASNAVRLFLPLVRR